MKRIITLVTLGALLAAVACVTATGPVPEQFTKEVTVFGVTIWATESVTDEKLLHAGRVLAQYLDNDEDGIADVPAVVSELTARNATLVMFGTQSEAESFDPSVLPSTVTAVQDLYNSETNPDFNPNSANSYFDASLEEILHLISAHGYANAWPQVFGVEYGSEIANAMDKARSGYYPEVPALYPEEAWFTYYDTTCNYECQITEYLYWAITSNLGAQDYPGRFEEINEEWKLNTPQLLQTTDQAVLNILNNSEYNIPTILPDGIYNGFTIQIVEINQGDEGGGGG